MKGKCLFHKQGRLNMKENLQDKHFEMVIDKAYNQRKKVKVKSPLIILLSLAPWLKVFDHWVEHDDASIGLMILLFCFIYYSNLLIVNIIKETWVNKRLYAFTFIITMVFFASTVALAIMYFGKENLSVSGNGLFIVIGAFTFLAAIIYIAVGVIRTKHQEKTKCNTMVQAICIGYNTREVNRFVDNSWEKNYERGTSVAYGDSATVVIHTPIFQFVWNNLTINSVPNISSNSQDYLVGNVYNIYINPDNPSEIRI